MGRQLHFEMTATPGRVASTTPFVANSDMQTNGSFKDELLK